MEFWNERLAAGVEARSRVLDGTVGIASIGYYVPPGIITSEEISLRSGVPLNVLVERIGMERKHVAGPDEHPAEMGIRAAAEAVRKSGADPADIGIIAYCGAGFYDYRMWSPAARIQDAIGADDCYTFELRNGCNGGNLGLKVCKDLLLSDPCKSHALVVCSDKLSLAIDYSDPQTVSLFTVADGSAAALLAKGEPSNRILSYASVTDGSMVDFVKVPYGGTRRPSSNGNGRRNGSPGYISVEDGGGVDLNFPAEYLENYLRVIKEAVEKSGRRLSEVDHIFTNQVRKGLLEEILGAAGLEEHDSMFSIGGYGQMGATDTLFCLARSLEEGRIHDHDLVVLASSATGFTWGATVIEFGAA